jgi:hypothetical protein
MATMWQFNLAKRRENVPNDTHSSLDLVQISTLNPFFDILHRVINSKLSVSQQSCAHNKSRGEKHRSIDCRSVGFATHWRRHTTMEVLGKFFVKTPTCEPTTFDQHPSTLFVTEEICQNLTRKRRQRIERVPRQRYRHLARSSPFESLRNLTYSNAICDNILARGKSPVQF